MRYRVESEDSYAKKTKGLSQWSLYNETTDIAMARLSAEQLSKKIATPVRITIGRGPSMTIVETYNRGDK